MNCLILDDNPDIAHPLVECLREMGRRADPATTAADAMRRLEAGRYNCLGVDYFLNGTNAAEIIRWLRASAEERLRNMPVLVMTAGCAEVAEEIRAELRDLQPADLIRKPFFPSEFLETMQRLRGEAAELAQKGG